MLVEEYRGYKVWKNYTTRWYSNKISGHEWPEDTANKTYYISGKCASCNAIFKSIGACRRHIDYLIKHFISYEPGGEND